MKVLSVVCFFFLLLLIVSEDATGQKLKKKKKKKKKSSIKPPIRLGPGEVPVQEPGWKTVNRYKIGKVWRQVKSDGYPKFTGTQMQASWILEAPIGWRVKVAFKDLQVAPRVGSSCSKCYIDLIDPKAGKSQGRSCGNESPGDYVSMGNFMRIDLMSDNFRGKFRGFLIYAIMTRDTPGLRSVATRTFPAKKTASDGGKSSGGKISFSDLKAMRTVVKPPKPTFPKNVRMLYASDLEAEDALRESLQDTDEDTEEDDSDWIEFPYVVEQPKPDSGGARMRYRPPTNNQPDFEEEEENEAVEENPFYSNINQPVVNWQLPIVEYEKEEKKEEGFSTLHLIIIVTAVVISIIIISAVFLIKKCYVDRLDKLHDERNRDDRDDDDRPKGAHKLFDLPGLDPELAQKKQDQEQMEMVRYQNTTGLQPPPYSLSGERPATFYGATPLHPVWERTQSSMYRRPLPPPPPTELVGPPLPRVVSSGAGQRVAAEDYCSGDEEEGNVVTLKHEYSTWELQKKNPKIESLCEY